MPRRRRQQTDLGARLREVRQRRRWTLSVLSQETGINASSLSRYERGISTPAFEEVCRIAQALTWPLLYFAAGRLSTGDHPRDLYAHLVYWGLSDVQVREVPLFGEVKPFEELIVRALDAGAPARILEAVPALLLKEPFEAETLLDAARARRALQITGWAAEVAGWIATRLSAGAVAAGASERVEHVRAGAWKERGDQWEWLDPSSRTKEKPSTTQQRKVPPVSRKWKVYVPISQERFLKRATELLRK